MNHFIPILNKYNTVKKKLKAKVTERKELNVQKDKTSILNPIQHIKLNQQLTTVTEEIEELKSQKEQLIFQAQCSTDKDMTNLSKKYDQMNKNLDILDSQDTSLKKQLKKMLPLSGKKNFVLIQNNIQNYWIPESRYVLLSGIS